MPQTQPTEFSSFRLPPISILICTKGNHGDAEKAVNSILNCGYPTELIHIAVLEETDAPQPIEGTQAKVMKYFMPGMFTVMMLALPSGLTLYIFVNTVLTMIHQWYMNKTDKDPTSSKDTEKKEGERAKPPSKRETSTEAKEERDESRQRPKRRRRRRKK